MMKDEHKTKKQLVVEETIPERRIWLPVAGMFVLLCILAGLNEIVDLPRLLLGASHTPINWRETIIEMVLIASVGLYVVLRLIRDITERVRAEEALRESDRRYRLLAENTTDAIWTMDMDLQFTYISPPVTDMLGYSVEEAMAQTLEEVLTPASLEVAREALAEALVAVEPEDLYEFELNESLS